MNKLCFVTQRIYFLFVLTKTDQNWNEIYWWKIPKIEKFPNLKTNMSHTTTRLKHGSKVYVNVYDLGNNEFLYPFGLGFYHSGIEIDGRGLIQEVLYLTRIEYTYSKSGVFSSTPKEAPPAVFR